MSNISQLINDIHYCYFTIGSGQRCPNCSHYKQMNDDSEIECDEFLLLEAIRYLKEYDQYLSLTLNDYIQYLSSTEGIDK